MVYAILVILVLAVLAVLAIAAMKPDSFSLRRETDIAAPPEKVFALINDFHEWPKWSPWEKLDPDLQRTHSGAASGKGAVYAWSGNKKVGQGRMEILDGSPHAIKIKLDFLKPFEAHNVTDFTLEPRNGGTHVTWIMSGPPELLHETHACLHEHGQDGRQGLRGRPCQPEGGGGNLRDDEPDDFPRLAHDRAGNRPGAGRAILQDAFNIGGIGLESLGLSTDLPEFRHRQIGQGILEA